MLPAPSRKWMTAPAGTFDVQRKAWSSEPALEQAAAEARTARAPSWRKRMRSPVAIVLQRIRVRQVESYRRRALPLSKLHVPVDSLQLDPRATRLANMRSEVLRIEAAAHGHLEVC